MINLTNIDGTIANALYQNMDKIAACGTDVLKAKQVVKSILESVDVKSEKAREDAIRILTGAPNHSAFLSTLATYLTGMKVGSTKQTKTKRANV